MSFAKKLYDIIIISTGSCGGYIAYKLAEKGFNVLVIDKNDDRTNPICCTSIISKECFEKFEVGKCYTINELRSAVIKAPNGNSVRIKRAETQAYIVNRNAFNAYFEEKALENGAGFLRGVSIENITNFPNGASLKASDNSSYEAKIIIDAGGFNTKLIKTLTYSHCENCAIGIQCDVFAPDSKEVEIYLGDKISPGFFGWVAPINEGKARLGLIARNNAQKRLSNFIESLKKDNIKLGIASAPTSRPIPLKPIRKTFYDRLLIVGDSAGQVKPTSGGGIYFRLLCADCAIKTVSDAFNKCIFTEKQLSSYQKSWRDIILSDIKRGAIARNFYEHLNDEQINKLPLFAEKHNILDDLSNDESLKFDWHESAINTLIKSKFSDKIVGTIGRHFNSLISQLREGNTYD